MKKDIYQKVTDKIVADLEQGELSWLKPWNAKNLEGKITKPLRHNGMAYSGINVLMLWGAALEAGYLSPIASNLTEVGRAPSEGVLAETQPSWALLWGGEYLNADWRQTEECDHCNTAEETRAFFARDAVVSLDEVPGLTPKRAPAAMAACRSVTLMTVPTPTMASGTSLAMARTASSATADLPV